MCAHAGGEVWRGVDCTNMLTKWSLLQNRLLQIRLLQIRLLQIRLLQKQTPVGVHSDRSCREIPGRALES